MKRDKFEKSRFNNGGIKRLVQLADSMRKDSDRPVDVSFADVLAAEHDGLSIDDFYDEIGVDASFDTIQNIFTTPDESVRWLIPEVFRDALRLGYRSAPIWPSVTAQEQQVGQLSQHLPYLNMSEATPKKVGEGETIPVGTLSYGQRSFSIYKFGRGIKIPDEVQRYVSLAVISIFLEDFGVKMGYGVDSLAMNTLINGEQADGSNAAPVVGVASANTLAYRDLLKIWIRMAKIGRNPSTMLAGETMALDMLDLDAFKARAMGETQAKLNVKTPMPQSSNLYINGNINDDQAVIVDPRAALIKMNAVPLTVESERIVSNQTSAFYASFTTGFAKLFDDSCIILDRSKAIADNPIPSWIDVDADTWLEME